MNGLNRGNLAFLDLNFGVSGFESPLSTLHKHLGDTCLFLVPDTEFGMEHIKKVEGIYYRGFLHV